MPSEVGEKGGASKRNIVIAGAIAGLVSRFVIAPLDVVKIRLQLQPDTYKSGAGNAPLYKGILPTVRKIVREEGVTALWKGNIPAELLYLTYGATQFLAYRQINRIITNTGLNIPESIRHTIAGGTAGGIATCMTYPFDLLRTRFASQGKQRVYESLLYSIKHIYAHEGSHGFFRGLSAAIIQIVPYMGIFFGTYESTRNFLLKHQHRIDHNYPYVPSSWPDAVAGTFAATVSKTVVFPFDLVRKRLQVQGPTRGLYVHRNIPEYKGVVDTMVNVVRQEGFRGLYKGFVISLIKAAPASAVTMWTFEQTLKFLQWKEVIKKNNGMT